MSRTGRKRTPWSCSDDRLRPIFLRPNLWARRRCFRSATLAFRRWSLNDGGGDGLWLPRDRHHGHLPGQRWQQSLPPWRVMAAETLVAMVMDFLHEQSNTLLPSAGSPCTARRTYCLPHGRGPTRPARFFLLRSLFVVLFPQSAKQSRISFAVHRRLLFSFPGLSTRRLHHDNWHYITFAKRRTDRVASCLFRSDSRMENLFRRVSEKEWSVRLRRARAQFVGLCVIEVGSCFVIIV